MGILEQSYAFLQSRILPRIGKRHRHLFTFGFEALTIRPYVSLNSNARMTVAVRNTAQSKMLRLMRNKQIPASFTQFVAHLALIGKTDVINVDFSTFCGFEVLTLAKQTHLGRSLPLFFGVLVYPVDEGSQTRFVMETIKTCVSLLGFAPHMVFDRGFESPFIVPFLVNNRIPFTMRLRKDKHAIYQKKNIPLRNLPWYEKDCLVDIYEEDGGGEQLRIVISEKLSERKDSEGKEEPWYILTNDYESTKEAIIARYYFRFEIEETFKDLKHVLTLKKFYRIKTIQTFTVLLWFYTLALWIAFLLEPVKQYLSDRIFTKKRKRLSFVKFFTEHIQLELFSSFKLQFF